MYAIRSYYADIILLASGSEVSTLVAGAELLEKDGVKCRIVSVPSEGLFRSQSEEYQAEVLPAGVRITSYNVCYTKLLRYHQIIGRDGVKFEKLFWKRVSRAIN